MKMKERNQVKVELRGKVALCTITNPPHGYMDEETTRELNEVMEELAQNEAVRAVVLAGGVVGYFIRHYSVGELEKIARGLKARGTQFDTNRLTPPRTIDKLFDKIETMPKVVIAAINGSAMGGGFETALACDIRIAQAGDFALGLPEINIGILPGAGGTQRLTRLVGVARALELVLRGRTVNPEEALKLGMVHEVAESAVSRAVQIADEIAAKSPLAVKHIKSLIRNAPVAPLEEGLARERTLFLDLMVSDEAIELMSKMNRGELEIRGTLNDE
jgi:enoyl-CoA hydratase/carnithine racemase